MKIAVHQPNYIPWLGYFYKLASADAFIFLDNVQFSKGSYTNRVRIKPLGACSAWLTVPVSVHLGDLISDIKCPKKKWIDSHLSCLLNAYNKARFFKVVWQDIMGVYNTSPEENLCDVNMHFIVRLAEKLGIACKFYMASDFQVAGESDDRLIELVSALDSKGVYLSGAGGIKYQDVDKFTRAGIDVRYTDFTHPSYPQFGENFEPGLSILDAVFHLGWDGCADFFKNKVSV